MFRYGIHSPLEKPYLLSAVAWTSVSRWTVSGPIFIPGGLGAILIPTRYDDAISISWVCTGPQMGYSRACAFIANAMTLAAVNATAKALAGNFMILSWGR